MNAIRWLTALAVLALPLRAQTPATSVTVSHGTESNPLVHYGKWLVGLAAVGFTALGAHEHANSDQVYNQLLTMCRGDPTQCDLKPDGTYENAAAEQLYQTSLHYDSRARWRLLAGEASLLLCAGLFFADLRHHGSGPDNIPYHPPLELSLDPRPDGTRVGVTIKF
jgi:hypothetical protein